MKLRPSLLRKLLALSFDGYVILFIYISLFLYVPKISDESIEIIAPLFSLLIYLVYEVLLISYSRTVGQRMLGLKCVSFSDGKKLTLAKSLLRFLTKIPLGMFSFLTIFLNHDHRGVHDYLSKSIIINASEKHPPESADQDIIPMEKPTRPEQVEYFQLYTFRSHLI